MTKDNWIKALGKYGLIIGAGEHSEYGYFLNEKAILSLLSQVEKDAIEKTNKRWGERCRKLKRKPSLLDIVVPAFSAEARNRRDIKYYNKALSDLLEDKK